MGKVIELNNVTRLDIPVGRVLSAAKNKMPRHVMIVGWDEDGDMYFASSVADGPECLWLLELAKRELLKACDE